MVCMCSSKHEYHVIQLHAQPAVKLFPCNLFLADCTGNPPNVTGLQWQCAPSTVSGGECRANTCEPGFTGGPVSIICNAGSWSNTTTGTPCTRYACVGSPPSPPTATYSCTLTPITQSCVAKCAEGLSGNIYRICLANGTFGPPQGDAACGECLHTGVACLGSTWQHAVMTSGFGCGMLQQHVLHHAQGP